jgi:hypothetical protein
MTQIVIPALLRSKMPDLSEPFEFTDESGRVLGHFLPAFNAADYVDLEPQISREELERRKQMKGEHYTTAEVLARLEKL